jgi:hypothetical protein
MMGRLTFTGASAVAVAVLIGTSLPAYATAFTDFEAAGFAVGESVHNHQTDGTLAAPPIANINLTPKAWFVPRWNQATPPDEEIVDVGGPHGKVWRLSPGTTIGTLGGAPQSPHMDGVAGETGALNDAGRGPVTTNTFYGEFDFRSATGAGQTGLTMNVNAGSFDQRHGYVRIIDDGASGLSIGFFDTVGETFNFTTIATGLSYTDWHKIGIEILFNDGLTSGTFGDDDAIGNDIVKIYIDGMLAHTGTSWESVYAGAQDHAESVDSLQFSGTTNAALLGGGLYFDNILVTDVGPAAVPAPGTLALFGLGLAGLGLVRRRKAA